MPCNAMDADDASSAEMRRRHADRDADPPALDEETVERLLTGELDAAHAPPGYAHVGALLAATVAAPSHEELVGKEAALVELRAVTGARAATRPAAKPIRRRRVGLAAVVVVGALATGGAAAAASGHLPEPVREASRKILSTVGAAEPATPGAQPAPRTPPYGTGRVGQQPTTTGALGAGSGTTGADPAASPNLTGLCRAYLAGMGAESGKRLDATAFRALARAAGGEDKVEAWCRDTLRADARPGKPSDKQPAPPGDPGEDQGQGGPPPANGGNSQGNPPATQSRSR
jgi:hypothetical protein